MKMFPLKIILKKMFYAYLVFRRKSKSSFHFEVSLRIQSRPISRIPERPAKDFLASNPWKQMNIITDFPFYLNIIVFTYKWCSWSAGSQRPLPHKQCRTLWCRRQSCPGPLGWSRVLRPNSSPSTCTSICDLWTFYTVSL